MTEISLPGNWTWISVAIFIRMHPNNILTHDFLLKAWSKIFSDNQTTMQHCPFPVLVSFFRIFRKIVSGVCLLSGFGLYRCYPDFRKKNYPLSVKGKTELSGLSLSLSVEVCSDIKKMVKLFVELSKWFWPSFLSILIWFLLKT